MRYLLAALALLAQLCVANAQDLLLGAGQAPKAAAVGYQGPGDLVSGWKVWYSIYSCFSSSYVGSVADVYAPADASHTLITCSSGGVVNETLQSLATTCTISCTVKTIYDQSGANNCSGSPCPLDTSTAGHRPTVTVNCLGSLPCATFNAASTQAINSSSTPSTINQPFSLSVAAERTGNTSSYAGVFIGESGTCGQFFNNGTNNAASYCGSAVKTASANDNAVHAMQSIFDDSGSGSLLYIDGSNTSTTGTGTGGFGGALILGCQNSGCSQALTGYILEAGAVTGRFSGGQLSSLNSNQHSRWGF